MFTYVFDSRICCVGGEFWTRHRLEFQQGSFWADEIKKIKDDPERRLVLALQNLPLPAAFSEAAKALREIIRRNRAAREPWAQPLQMLYSIAGVESFVSASHYIEQLGEPAFNALEMLSEADWVSLQADYVRLGYKRLPLLTKTDCKWIIEEWGEPKKHTTLRDVCPDVWSKAVNALGMKRVQEENASWLNLGRPEFQISLEEYLARQTAVRKEFGKS